MLKHRVTATPQPPSATSSSSLESCVSENIDITPNDGHTSDNSSVVDSDSEDEKNNQVAEMAMQNTQVQNILRGMDFGPKIDQVKVADSTELTIGSRMVFEGGSSVTFVVHDNKPEVDMPKRGSSESKRRNSSRPEKTISWSRFQRLKLRKKLFLGSFLGLLLTTVIGLIVAFILLNDQPIPSTLAPTTTTNTSPETTSTSSTNTSTTSTSTTDTTSLTTTIDPIFELINVTREEWSTRPPNGTIETRSFPASVVIVTSTVTLGCNSPDVCMPRLREIQTKQMTKQYNQDIVYNLLLSSDGGIYEGRDWDKVSECAAEGLLNDSVCVGFIGTFSSYSPVPKQLSTFDDLLRKGVELGLITTDYRICGEQNLTRTAIELFGRVSRLDRWHGVVPNCLETLS